MQPEGGWVFECGLCEHQEYSLDMYGATISSNEHLFEMHGLRERPQTECPVKFQDLPCTYFEDREADSILDADLLE